MKELTDAFDTGPVTVLKDSYPMVVEPGPDVARLRIALTNVKKSEPVVGIVTSIVPVGIGMSIIEEGGTGSWTGSGAASAEFTVLDSSTNDVIAVTEDEQTAKYFERFSRLGLAKGALKYWAERIEVFLDEAHGVKK